MNYIMTIMLALSISACSMQVKDMTPEPTVQKFDLADSEADGVINARDDCSDSLSGALVGNLGCGFDHIEKESRTLRVNFTNGSYAVGNEFLPEIKQLSDFMNEFPSANLTIEGHTSKQGANWFNNILSQDRAQSIKNILVNTYNIEQARITAIGYSSNKLIVEGDDEESHARNRRIIAVLSSHKSATDMKWTIYSVDQAAGISNHDGKYYQQ
ncbi:OmpA family protein [Colwellia sp. MB02u-10]|jgi:OOP family OmpA-OmpF porin|uniref:OmpA family protein n=1 Tax=Colwellia sp. MB02u-10 TaxID=2759828 RepID=UPI0015F5AE0A|nr:OmpA family protein [Colwellia sp. MB02u-10]MBA6340128.1 OmpA family protein [Colwellia sp. MB02u-10]